MIRVYSTPNCVQCRATYRWLDLRNIDYQIEDATTLENRDAFKALGYRQAPVVVVETPDGDEHWSGFQPDLLETYCNPKDTP